RAAATTAAARGDLTPGGGLAGPLAPLGGAAATPAGGAGLARPVGEATRPAVGDTPAAALAAGDVAAAPAVGDTPAASDAAPAPGVTGGPGQTRGSAGAGGGPGLPDPGIPTAAPALPAPTAVVSAPREHGLTFGKAVAFPTGPVTTIGLPVTNGSSLVKSA